MTTLGDQKPARGSRTKPSEPKTPDRGVSRGAHPIVGQKLLTPNFLYQDPPGGVPVRRGILFPRNGCAVCRFCAAQYLRQT